MFGANRQCCRVHWMRNPLVHAPTKSRPAVAAMLKTIFAQGSKADAEDQWAEVAEALKEKHPKLGQMMDQSCDSVLILVTNDEWAVASRYISLDPADGLIDTETVRLLAVAS